MAFKIWTPETLLSHVVAKAAKVAVENGANLGVSLRDLPRLSMDELRSELRSTSGQDEFRIACISGNKATITLPETADFTSDTIRANEWRNDKMATSRPMLLMADGEVAKLRSLLSALRPLDNQNLRDQLKKTVLPVDSGGHPTSKRRSSIWDYMVDEESHTLASLTYVACAYLNGLPSGQLTAERAEVNALHALGLFALSHRDDTGNVFAEMKRNSELVRLLRTRDSDTNKRLNRAVGKGGNNGKIATKCLKFGKVGDNRLLEGLNFDDVENLLRGSQEDHAVKNSGETSTEKKERIHSLDEAVLEGLLDGMEDEDEIKAVFDKIDEYSETDGGDETTLEFGKENAPVSFLKGLHKWMDIIDRGISHDCWGGIISNPNGLFSDALLNAFAEENNPAVAFAPFNPRDKGSITDILYGAADLLPGVDLMTPWNRYEAARKEVIALGSRLMAAPFGVVSTQDGQAVVQECLDAYKGALESVRQASDAMLDDGDSTSDINAFQRAFLCLDILYVSGKEPFALLSPLHPFSLNRVLKSHQTIVQYRNELKDMGDLVVRGMVSSDISPMPDLPVPFGLEMNERMMLRNGAIGPFLTFSDPSVRLPLPLKIDLMESLADRAFELLPYTRNALSVSLVDAPSLGEVLEALLRKSKEKGNGRRGVPLHVITWRTRPASDEEVHPDEFITEIERMGGSVDIREICAPHGDYSPVIKESERNPVHLMVVFGPGKMRAEQVRASRISTNTPLVLPKNYIYISRTNRFEERLAADIMDFSLYGQMARTVSDKPHDQILSATPALEVAASDLSRLGKSATLFVLTDRCFDTTFSLKGFTKLHQFHRDDRESIILSSDEEVMSDTGKKVVLNAGIGGAQAGNAFLSRLPALYGNHYPLPILRAAAQVGEQARREAKALVGNVAASETILAEFPSALIMSLDGGDENDGRRWISRAPLRQSDRNRDDAKRSDLLAVVHEDGKVLFVVVEVKAWGGENAPARDDEVIVQALPQVTSTMARLMRMFEDRASPLEARAREELKGLCYRTLSQRQLEKAENKVWHACLLDVFGQTTSEVCSAEPPEVLGAIFRVIIGDRAEPNGRSGFIKNVEANVNGQSKEVAYSILYEGEGCLEPSINSEIPTTVVPAPIAPPTFQSSQDKIPPVFEATAQSPQSAHSTQDGEKNQCALIGYTMESEQRPVEFFFKTSDRQENFGLLVTGDPGTGKTTLLRTLIADVHAAGIPVTVLDVKNDYTSPDFADRLGIPVHDVYENGLPFNIMKFMPRYEGGDIDIRKNVKEFCYLMAIAQGGQLGAIQGRTLQDAVRAVLVKKGVMEHADIQRVPAEAMLHVPSFGDVVDEVGLRVPPSAGDKDSTASLHSRMRNVQHHFDHPANERSFEDIMSTSMVFKLNEVDDSEKALLAAVLLSRLHTWVLRGPQPQPLRRLIVLDEAWRLKGNTFLDGLTREGRAFGVGCAIGTQYAGDLDDDGTSIQANLAMRIFMKNADAEKRRAVRKEFGGQGSDTAAMDYLIDNLGRGQGLIRSATFPASERRVIRVVRVEDRKTTP